MKILRKKGSIIDKNFIKLEACPANHLYRLKTVADQLLIVLQI